MYCIINTHHDSGNVLIVERSVSFQELSGKFPEHMRRLMLQAERSKTCISAAIVPESVAHQAVERSRL